MTMVPQTTADRKTLIARIVARLVQLTEREQELYAQEWRDEAEVDELERLAAERIRLLHLKEALRIGADVTQVPRDCYPADANGFRLVKPRRRPDGSRVIAARDLPSGLERTTSGRIRCVVYIPPNRKLSLGMFSPQLEQIELAAAMAKAGREARDQGLSEGEIRAAALAVYRDRSLSLAADECAA
jgi:hypothetical protein